LIGRVVAIAGTETSIGKTTFATAWIRLLAKSGLRVLGWKPIETGGCEDVDALGVASGLRVPALYAFDTPVSPHLAARLQSRRIELDSVVTAVAGLARTVEVLVVEMAGGLFTPLDDDGATNADLVRKLPGAELLLVAPNRLGVLHDVGACRRAAEACGLAIAAVVLTGEGTDASATSNFAELTRQGLTVVEMRARSLSASSDEALRRGLRFT
jgi:dethiobiotin synthetase